MAVANSIGAVIFVWWISVEKKRNCDLVFSFLWVFRTSRSSPSPMCALPPRISFSIGQPHFVAPCPTSTGRCSNSCDKSLELCLGCPSNMPFHERLRERNEGTHGPGRIGRSSIQRPSVYTGSITTSCVTMRPIQHPES